MQIRPAVAEDAPTISALMLGEAHHVTLQPDGQGAETILDSMREPAVAANMASDRFAYWVAVQDSMVQGVISLRDGKHLYQMFVSSDQHGRGIGRQLWQYLLMSLADKPHTKAITVNASAHAVPVYQRFGFAATGVRTETHGVAFFPMIFNFSTST